MFRTITRRHALLSAEATTAKAMHGKKGEEQWHFMNKDHSTFALVLPRIGVADDARELGDVEWRVLRRAQQKMRELSGTGGQSERRLHALEHWLFDFKLFAAEKEGGRGLDNEAWKPALAPHLSSEGLETIVDVGWRESGVGKGPGGPRLFLSRDTSGARDTDA